MPHPQSSSEIFHADTEIYSKMVDQNYLFHSKVYTCLRRLLLERKPIRFRELRRDGLFQTPSYGPASRACWTCRLPGVGTVVRPDNIKITRPMMAVRSNNCFCESAYGERRTRYIQRHR
jgi:hypothetical protein